MVNYLTFLVSDMQLFTAIRGKGAFLNGKPIKGELLCLLMSTTCMFQLRFDENHEIVPLFGYAVSSQDVLVKSLLATEVLN